MSEITALMQQTTDTQANWESKNPWLHVGQWGVEFDPANPGVKPRVKIGIGQRWNDTPFDPTILPQERRRKVEWFTSTVTAQQITLPLTYLPSEVFLVFHRGIPQHPTLYSVSGRDVTLYWDITPGDSLAVDYEYLPGGEDSNTEQASPLSIFTATTEGSDSIRLDWAATEQAAPLNTFTATPIDSTSIQLDWGSTSL